jgi:hypothetical protein
LGAAPRDPDQEIGPRHAAIAARLRPLCRKTIATTERAATSATPVIGLLKKFRPHIGHDHQHHHRDPDRADGRQKA